MERSPLPPPALPARSALFALLALFLGLSACRPPIQGPTPWNVLVVTLDGLTHEHLAEPECEGLQLVGEATHYGRAYSVRPNRRSALETLWVGDAAGLASGARSLPKHVHSYGIVTSAMLASPLDEFDPDLLLEFTRVEPLPFDQPVAASLGEATRKWLDHTKSIHMGSWLLWMHGRMQGESPAALFARIEAELAQAGVERDTLVLFAGMPQIGLDGHVPLTIYTPQAGLQRVAETIGLQDLAPTLAERMSQRLLAPVVAEQGGDGVSVAAAMLGLEVDRAPVVIHGLEPDGATIEVRDEDYLYRWSPGDTLGQLVGFPQEEPEEERELQLERLHSAAFVEEESGPTTE